MFEIITKTPITTALKWPPVVIGCILIIVCISSIIYTTVNYIMNIDNSSIEYTDDGNVIIIKKINSNFIFFYKTLNHY